MRWAPLLLVTLVVTAGCTTIFEDDRTPQPEVTPVPVTDEQATATPTNTPLDVDYPVGINSTGVTNTYRVRQSHFAALDDRSFTLVVRGFTVNETGELERINQTAAVGADGRIHWQKRGEERRQWWYVTENRTYQRRYNDSADRWEARYFPRNGSSRVTRVRFARRPMLTVTENMNVTTVVRRDGRRLLRLFTSEAPTGRADDVKNYTATAYVTPDGLVRTAVVSFESPNGDRRKRRITIRRVGETTVETPAWVERARPARWLTEPRNETTTTTATARG